MNYFTILIKLLFFISFVVANEVSQTKDEVKSRKVFENKSRYGGDMMGIVPQPKGVARKASSASYRIWPNAIVYYQFADNTFNYLIEYTMKYIQSISCIKFIKRTNQNDFINIMKGQGCYSYVGRIGGSQDLSLGRGCMFKGTIIHEFMHALNFYHEHMRSDRDSYLKIHMNNVVPGMSPNFEKNPPSMNKLLAKFDPNSIMIYSSTAFSKNGQMTMEPKDKKCKLYEPYDKTQMTKLDALSLNKMYNCPKK